jgi:hypothetical protein
MSGFGLVSSKGIGNPAMTIIEWFFSPRSRNDWNSWWALTFTLEFFIALAVLIPQSLRNAEIGARQRQVGGVVTAYDRSNHNQCRYSFSVDGSPFVGVSSAPADSTFAGEQVQVYFDPINPAANSLKDFSASSRRTRGVIYLSFLGVFAVTGFIIYNKVKNLGAQG